MLSVNTSSAVQYCDNTVECGTYIENRKGKRQKNKKLLRMSLHIKLKRIKINWKSKLKTIVFQCKTRVYMLVLYI